MAISKIESASLATGVPGRSQLPAGTVLQVVSSSTTTNVTTTSTTAVTTNHSVSITPTSASSKILVLVSAYVSMNNSPCNGGNLILYRNASSVSGSARSVHAGFDFVSYNGYGTTNAGINYLDSPATTSSTTYTVYMSSNGGTLSYCSQTGAGVDTSVATITVMEIAA